jgi:hypothetical protein
MEITADINFTNNILSTRVRTILDTEQLSYPLIPEFGYQDELFDSLSQPGTSNAQQALNRWLSNAELVFVEIDASVDESGEVSTDVRVEEPGELVYGRD